MQACEICGTDISDGVGSKGGPRQCPPCSGHTRRNKNKPPSWFIHRYDLTNSLVVRYEWSLAAKATKLGNATKNRIAEAKQRIQDALAGN